MFDNNDIDSYRRISAPDELRGRIIESCRKQNSALKFSAVGIHRLSALAACLVLVAFICVFTVGKNDRLSVWVNGEKLSSREITLSDSNAGIAPAMARSVPVYSVPIELRVSRMTQISVSAGIMQIFDAETGELIATDTIFYTEKNIRISWEVSDLETEPKMYVADSKDSFVITPKYDASANRRTVSRRKN